MWAISGALPFESARAPGSPSRSPTMHQPAKFQRNRAMRGCAIERCAAELLRFY